jgi:hypothetical protein
MTHETRVYNAFDDVASNIYRTLGFGIGSAYSRTGSSVGSGEAGPGRYFPPRHLMHLEPSLLERNAIR